MKKYNKKFMNSAIAWSKYSYCKRKQVGAVLVKDNREIASGYNGTISGSIHKWNNEPDNLCEDSQGITKDSVIHAERNIIAYCAKHGISTDECTMYITYSPCQGCAVLMAQSGIKEVIYQTEYKDTTGIKILKDANINIYQYKG